MSSHPSPLDPMLSGVRPPRPATVKRSSVGEVGVHGGTVEDGSAWSMVARFVCSVPGCAASFTRKQNLQRHQTQKHGRPKSNLRAAAADNYDDDEDDDDDDGALAGFY